MFSLVVRTPGQLSLGIDFFCFKFVERLATLSQVTSVAPLSEVQVEDYQGEIASESKIN